MNPGTAIAYFDCFSGISGDMTLGALLDCGADPAVLDAVVESLRLADEVSVEVRREVRGHTSGTRVVLDVTDRVERTVPALRAVVGDSDAPEKVKAPALDTIDRLARAEAAIHGVPEEKLHLHELGGADTLVDVVGAFWLLHSLEELVTPTGAAILAAAARFERPAMSLRRVGYGLGTHPSPGNALAVWLGDEVATEKGVTLLETNLDDMAPNVIAALAEDLMSAGALDVTVVPALMKKGRAGHLVTVMAPPELVARLADHLLRHSTTLGMRLTPVERVVAARRVFEVATDLGPAHVKVKEMDGRAIDVAPEYEDCRRISRDTGVDLREVMRVVAEAARRELGLD